MSVSRFEVAIRDLKPCRGKLRSFWNDISRPFYVSMRTESVVILDAEIAALYAIETKNLVKAVKRNLERFPVDFMFQLTPEEVGRLRFQIGTSNTRGGRRYLPYAFTEQGVAMLSGVLRSEQAVKVNVEIMRAFVRLRRMVSEQAELARKLDALEERYDEQFKVVFDALRELMAPPGEIEERRIGF